MLLLLRVLCRRMQLSARWSLHRGIRLHVLLVLLLLMMCRCRGRWSSEAGEVDRHRRGHFCSAAIARTTTPTTTAAGVSLHVQQRRTEHQAVRICRIMVMLVVLLVIVV
jgi:hypothetical protein